MKPRTGVVVLGALLIIAAVVVGSLRHEVVERGWSYDCGSAFHSSGVVDPDLIAQCADARMLWLPWLLLGVGALVLAAGLVIHKEPART